MGLTFNGKHSDDFGFCFVTLAMPVIAPKRQTTISVMGRDGQYVFEDGYDNIKIELECTIASEEIFDRRKRAREIAGWLANTGALVFDYEIDVEYKVVKTVNDAVATMDRATYRDTFTIIFECKPHPNQTYYNDGLIWGTAIPAWGGANIPWNGYTRQFVVNPGSNIEVVNAGTYKALPIVVLSGTASSVSFGSFGFNNLNGVIYIDCENMVVYSISNGVKTNRLLDFIGDFPKLIPGTNAFPLSGSFSNLAVEFNYKNTYL